MSASLPSDCESLLAHAGWIRSLARSLVADPSLAEDLVQDTWLAALERPPRSGVPIRRWLAAVLRNFARQEHRRSDRRRAREALHARSEALPSADDSGSMLAVQRELLDAVGALEEPYRTVILQRYYEGLPPRAIAERQGVPVKTVQTRLARALARLRARLDREHAGDRRVWVALLVPFARGPSASGAIAVAVLVSVKLKLALLAITLVGALALLWKLSEAPAEIVARAPALGAGRALETTASEEEVADVGEQASQARTGAAEVLSQETTPPPASARVIAGRVVDVEGRPVAAVPLISVIVWKERRSQREEEKPEEPATVATSRTDGTFELTAPLEGQALAASRSLWTTVFAANLQGGHFDLRDLAVVVAPPCDLAGTVVDSDGTPVEGAEVRLRADRNFGARIDVTIDGALEIPRVARTDEHGCFTLLEAPAMTGATLRASAPGYESASVPAPEGSARDVRIVLKTGGFVLRGEVLDARGTPTEGAWVAFGGATAHTDERGRFAVDPSRAMRTVVTTSTVARGKARGGGVLPAAAVGAELPTEVLTAAKGWLPARLERPAAAWPAFVTLQLSGAPLEIHGRVVDAAGGPLSDVHVWAIDESEFGTTFDDIYDLEGGAGHHRSIESVARDENDWARGGNCRSGADGRFVLRGLLPRTYRLGCVQESTLLTAETDPVAAGTTDAEIVLGGAEACARIAGRVVSLRGEPVAGVLVQPARPIARWPFPHYAAPWTATGVTTDAQGRFAFERLAPKDLSLMVVGEAIWTRGFWKPPASAELDRLEIPVRMLCRVQIDLGDRPDLADGFGVLSEAGKRIDAAVVRGSTMGSSTWYPVENGRSPIVCVPENVRMIELTKQGRAPVRMPIDLVPGRLTIIRP